MNEGSGRRHPARRGPRRDPRRDRIIARLRGLPGAGTLSLRAGQVLVYRGHVPPGVFVLLEGVLGLHRSASPTRGARRTLSPGAGALVLVPAPGDLEEPSALTVAALGDARVLFVPRSIVQQDAECRRVLAWASSSSASPDAVPIAAGDDDEPGGRAVI